MTPVTAVTARAPAKVNLQLAVGRARADGYHDVVTVYHAVSLFDEVTVSAAERDTVTVTGEGASSVPADGGNLAARAAAALLRAVGNGCRDSPGLAIQISKRIPVAAGLAGGSADAAATLVACNELWGTGLSHADLSALASGLGSDVAFALLGGTAIGFGRGERVTPALAYGTFHWVLAFAAGELSTARVYAAYDRIRGSRATAGEPAVAPGRAMAPADAGGTVGAGGAVSGGGAAGAGGAVGARRAEACSRARDGGRTKDGGKARDGGRAGGSDGAAAGSDGAAAGGALTVDNRLMVALRSGNPAELGPLLSNDLQPAAISLYPGLRRALAAGTESGALGAIVSGSGPTCAYLAKDAHHARDLAVALAGAGVCRTVAHVTGPAPGAAVVAISPEPG